MSAGGEGPGSRSISLAGITAQFSGSEWQRALAALIRQSQLTQDRASRLLHDQTGQNLSAAGLQLSALLHEIKEHVPELPARIAGIQSLLEKAMDQVREVSRELNPSAVDRAGLRFALEHLIEERRPPFEGTATIELAEGARVPRPVSRALACVAGYCLDHACKGGAKVLRIRVVPDALGWILEVLYDGSSPPSSIEGKAADRLSLLRLQYYAMSHGVEVAIEEAPGGATLMRAAWSAPDESPARAVPAD
jgi:signal transduction histidine kinase